MNQFQTGDTTINLTTGALRKVHGIEYVKGGEKRYILSDGTKWSITAAAGCLKRHTSYSDVKR